jgi:retron-type reverse transcriptase
MGKVFSHGYEHIISVENLLCAWKEFKRGKTKRKDVQGFEMGLMDNILLLHSDLKNKGYTHGSYQRFIVCDPKRRDIHKASVRDRLLHHALYRKLYPFFDTTFIAESYSCRDNKGTHRAMKRFDTFARKVSRNHTRTAWVLKCDIRKFFASIDHQILTAILKQKIQDKDILNLLENIIKSFSPGLPLGNLTSQLLVNIYMNEFDQWVKHKLKAKYYIRYADDFVFLSEEGSYLEDDVRQKVEDFLTHHLKLSLHPDKVFIKTFASGVDFLGWVHFPYHKVIRSVTKRRILRKANEKNVTSYVGLLRHGNAYRLSRKIGESISE